MRSSIIVILLVFLLLLNTATVMAQQSIASPDVFKIEASDCLSGQAQAVRVQTGFHVQGDIGIITALHGVVGCQTISAHSAIPGEDNIWNLQIAEADVDRDVAKLRSSIDSQENSVNTGFSISTDTSNNQYDGLYMIGHPYGVYAQITTQQITIGSTSSSQLQDLVPTKIIPSLAKRGSPNPKIEVISLEAHLVPGHSGAPVLNANGDLVGVGNGGLGDELSWIIPWKEIKWQPATDVDNKLAELAKLNPQEIFFTETSQNLLTQYRITGHVLSEETKKL